MKTKRLLRESIDCAEEFCREYLNSDGFTFNYGKVHVDKKTHHPCATFEARKKKLYELPEEPLSSWSAGWYAHSLRRGELPPYEDFVKLVREEVMEMTKMFREELS